MTFWVRFLEISADFYHRRSLFTTSFHYIFTTFSPQFTPQDIFTTSFHYIFTTNFHHKGTNRQGWTDSMGTHRQIFTTGFHHKFTPQISLSRECDLEDKQTKINLETVASSNILIHSPGNSVERGCTNFHHMWCKFINFHYVGKCKSVSQFSPHVV